MDRVDHYGKFTIRLRGEGEALIKKARKEIPVVQDSNNINTTFSITLRDFLLHQLLNDLWIDLGRYLALDR